MRRRPKPAPETVLRSSGNTLLPRVAFDPKPARWAERWSHVPHITLWEGVCLSRGIEPDRQIFDAPGATREWYRYRLDSVVRFLGDGQTFSQDHIPSGPPHEAVVLMREFAALALRLWADEIPGELKALVGAPPPTTALPKTAQQKEVAAPGTMVRRNKDRLAELLPRVQKACSNPDDAEEVWSRLRELATQSPPVAPLLGVDDGAVKWEDREGNVKFLKLRDLEKRLAR